MKIDVNSPTVSLLPVDAGAKKVSSGSLSGTQSATQDRTTFHSDALSVQSLTSQAMSSPEVRQGQVDALRQSIKSGEYQPDASKTADAIVNSKDV
jgi:flagellar biosynthesis anti-sigma factor FlgM